MLDPKLDDGLAGKPRTSALHSQQPPLKVGVGMLDESFLRWMSHMALADLDHLPSWMCHNMNSHIDIGALCCGTDRPLQPCSVGLHWHGWPPIFVNTQLHINHKYACEKDKAKRGFLKSMFPGMQRPFHDATEIPAGQGFQDLTGTIPQTPRVQHLVGGFPFLDRSSLNPNSNTLRARTCIAYKRPPRIWDKYVCQT